MCVNLNEINKYPVLNKKYIKHQRYDVVKMLFHRGIEIVVAVIVLVVRSTY